MRAVARVIEDELVEPVVGLLLGAMDVEQGPTDEQVAVLSAIVAGYWGRTDLDLGTVARLGPGEAAAAVTDPAHRRRVRELMVLLELCRHPTSAAQTARVDEYATALGEDGPGLALTRELVAGGAEAASADYQRFINDQHLEFDEPTLRGMLGDDAAANEALGARLRALHDLPPGTLGYEYVEFYRRNGITLPGEDPNSPAMFVAHDMSHVIAGYEPTGQGELSLGAMQLAIDDNDAHWMALLGNLGVHEAGFLGPGAIVPKTGTLTRAGAAEMFARAFLRGSRCTGDFTLVDHLALADLPLAEVRAQFGVPPLDDVE